VLAKKVSISGAGYVGLTTALHLAWHGHQVAVVDIDPRRIENLTGGIAPFVEPQLEELLHSMNETGRISFTTSETIAMSDSNFHLACVPTPQKSDGNLDLSVVEAVAESAIKYLQPGSVFVMKSTVPPGTCASLLERFNSQDLEIVANPEFLQVGKAVKQTFKPARIVVGAHHQYVANQVADLYDRSNVSTLLTDLTTAELIKLAANSYLAVRLSFVNEIAAVAQNLGANGDETFEGLGTDPRIGSDYLAPGPGWGGSCLPKDARALATIASKGAGSPVLEAALQSNNNRLNRLVETIANTLRGSIFGARVALLGLAFKPGTDDLRDSPALLLADMLLDLGAELVAYDPLVSTLPLKGIRLASTPEEAVKNAETVAIMNACPEFSQMELEPLETAMRGHTIVDACGVIDSAKANLANLHLVIST